MPDQKGSVTMMSKRQAEFRAEYRPRIPPWYSGLVHVAVIYAIGFAVLAYCIPRIHRPTWAEWLVIPAIFLASNAFEWWIHRYVMHRRQGVHGHLSPPHAGASSVLYRPRADHRHNPRLPHYLLPPYAMVTFIGCRCRRRSSSGGCGRPMPAIS